MIDSSNNPFHSAERQQKDLESKSWDKFAETNAENNKQNKIASKKKELLQDQIQAHDFAQKAIKGYDSHSSYKEP